MPNTSAPISVWYHLRSGRIVTTTSWSCLFFLTAHAAFFRSTVHATFLFLTVPFQVTPPAFQFTPAWQKRSHSFYYRGFQSATSHYSSPSVSAAMCMRHKYTVRHAGQIEQTRQKRKRTLSGNTSLYTVLSKWLTIFLLKHLLLPKRKLMQFNFCCWSQDCRDMMISSRG